MAPSPVIGVAQANDRTVRLGAASLYRGDALKAYEAWLAPTVIIADGPYGLGKFPGEPCSGILPVRASSAMARASSSRRNGFCSIGRSL